MSSVIPLPLYDRISRPRDWNKFPRPNQRDPQEGFLTDPFIKYFTANAQLVSQSAQRLTVVEASAQAASIAAVAFNLGTTQAGLYRVSYYATVSQAATTSSSLTVTVSWTDSVVKTSTSSAMTGNTTGTVLSGSFFFQVDQSSPITYATSYSTSGATPMQYTLVLVVERVQ